MTNGMIDRRRVCMTIALAPALCGDALAQAPSDAASAFPDHRIQVILPFPGGGIVDIVTRIVTDKMSETWKQPIIVEPRPGANGNIAWDVVARAAPDGYTWTFFSPSTIVNPRLQPGLRWSEKDFVAIGAAVWAPTVITVHPSLAANTIAEFIDHVHKNPRMLNWGNPGIGSSPHLVTALLLSTGKLDMVEVAYKGQPPAIIDLMANRIQMKAASIGLVAEHVKSGALKALAVVGKTRSPLLPSVPTLTEAGYADVNLVAWYGYAAPRATPPAIVDKIVAAFNAALADPKVRATLEAQGLQVVEPMNAADLTALVAADTEKYAKLIKDTGMKIDN